MKIYISLKSSRGDKFVNFAIFSVFGRKLPNMDYQRKIWHSVGATFQHLSKFNIGPAVGKSTVYDTVLKRKCKFLNKLEHSENTLCKMFQNNIQVELSKLSVLYCA